VATPHDDNPTQRALSLLQSNRVGEALTALEIATERFPNDAEAWCILGAVHGMRGEHEQAIGACQRALALRADYPEAWCNLGASQHDLARYDDAITSLSEAVRLRPQYLGALYNLGNSLKDSDRLIEAVDAYRRAIALQPDAAELHLNLGITLAQLRQHAEAVSAYTQALRLNDNLAEAHANIGNAQAALGQIGAALRHLHRATEINPQLAAAWNNLGNVLLRAARTEEARNAYQRALKEMPTLGSAQHNLLYALNFDPALAPEFIADQHRHWGKQLAARTSPIVSRRRPDPERRLRIGYVLPDPGARAIAHTIEPTLAAHDSDAFEIFGYVNAAMDSPVATRMRRHAAHWQSIHRQTDAEVAALVSQNQIDILVDAGGHAEFNRLEVFAYKPAPVQISWLGYPNTTGLPTMDYYLADSVFLPPGDMEQLYVERALRVPTWICYQAPADAPEVAPSPAIRDGRVTFGSLNTLAKVNASVIALWAKILRVVPNARLLMQAQALADDDVQQKLIEQFRRHGVSSERIDIVGPLSPIDHLRLHEKIDIALDPFPWSGWATTCHSLWMGVPVITLSGRSPAGRSGAALLSAVGRHDLVAATADDYARIAVTLAGDIAQLATTRREQRQRVAASALCDTTGFTRSLERAYRAAWKEWCRAGT